MKLSHLRHKNKGFSISLWVSGIAKDGKIEWAEKTRQKKEAYKEGLLLHLCYIWRILPSILLIYGAKTYQGILHRVVHESVDFKMFLF